MIAFLLGTDRRWLRELRNRGRRRSVCVCVCVWERERERARERVSEVLTLAGYSRSHPPRLPRGHCLCWLIHSHWLACSLRDGKQPRQRWQMYREREKQTEGEIWNNTTEEGCTSLLTSYLCRFLPYCLLSTLNPRRCGRLHATNERYELHP